MTSRLVAQHVTDDTEVPATARTQAADHDVADGPGEEDGEKGERYSDQPHYREAARQPRTVDVQSFIHCSRFWRILSCGTSTVFFGFVVYVVNSAGNAASLRTG